jgi:hypothetical protein
MKQDREPTVAERTLASAARYPYDANNVWWHSTGGSAHPPPPATDWAHAAARGVLRDLTDRRGVKRAFEGIDEDVRVDIVQALADIIRTAAKAAP